MVEFPAKSRALSLTAGSNPRAVGTQVSPSKLLTRIYMEGQIVSVVNYRGDNAKVAIMLAGSGSIPAIPTECCS